MLQLDDAGVNYADPDGDADFDRAMIMTVKQLLMFAVQISYGLVRLGMAEKLVIHSFAHCRNISAKRALCTGMWLPATFWSAKRPMQRLEILVSY